MRNVSLCFSLLTWLIYSVPAQAPIPPRAGEAPCRENYRQAWVRQDAELYHYSPCAPFRMSADCVNYPEGFVDSICETGRPCVQRQRAPGLYCWDGVRMAVANAPIRQPEPVARLPTRK